MSNVINKLRTIMVRDYVAVNRKKNPFAVGIASLTREQLLAVVSQYSIFPAHIVSFLLASRASAEQAGWNDVATELTRNVGEELGTQTKGVPHYNMLTRGISQELGGAPTAHALEATRASAATALFVATVEGTMADSRPAYVAGATYALESSAIPELVIVESLVKRLVHLSTGVEMKNDTMLATFFDLHLQVWEVGHEEGLRKTLSAVLPVGATREFEAGFREVMKTMDIWWASLHQEIVGS